jgi:Holliday junction resolvase RusA-like endonuclease
MKLEVVVEGRPVPKGSLMRGKGRALYYPPQVRVWEQKVRTACVDEMRRSGLPLVGARCRVSLRFFVTPTKGGKRPGTLIGDVDKLARCVMDAMNGVAYEDDVLVVGLLATKQPPEKGHVERVEISVALEEAA